MLKKESSSSSKSKIKLIQTDRMFQSSFLSPKAHHISSEPPSKSRNFEEQKPESTLFNSKSKEEKFDEKLELLQKNHQKEMIELNARIAKTEENIEILKKKNDAQQLDFQLYQFFVEQKLKKMEESNDSKHLSLYDQTKSSLDSLILQFSKKLEEISNRIQSKSKRTFSEYETISNTSISESRCLPKKFLKYEITSQTDRIKHKLNQLARSTQQKNIKLRSQNH